MSKESAEWLVGESELHSLVRAKDWATTPLGPRHRWPQSLRTAVGLVLVSKQPMCLAWGPDWHLIYNDGYRSILGARHPNALGRSARQVWAEVWDNKQPETFESVMTRGESVALDDEAYELLTDGRAEKRFFSGHAHPVRVEDGVVGGAIFIVEETTAAVRAEEKLQVAREKDAYLSRLTETLRSLSVPDHILSAAARLLGEHLAVERCLYATVVDEETIVVRRDHAKGLPSLTGTVTVTRVGDPIVDALRRGEDVVVVDAATDARLAAEGRGTMQRGGFAAAMAAGLVKGGRWVGLLAVHAVTARAWTEAERVLLRETAERTWAALARAEAEERVRASERLLADAERMAHVGSWEWDLQTGAVRWSRELYAIYELDPAEFVPTIDAFRPYVHPDDRALVETKISEILSSGARAEFDFRIVTPSGDTRVLATHGQITRFDPDGSPRVMTGTNQDVTERMQAAETMRLYEKSKERLLDLDAMERLHRVSARFFDEAGSSAVLEEILEAAIAITEADFGNVQVFDPRSSELAIVAQRGLPPPWVEFWNRVSRGRGACGTALERRERVVVEDVRTSGLFSEEALAVQLAADVHAVQSTPLFSRSGAPLGMISTHYRVAKRPSERALRFVDLLARQAGDILERRQGEAALRRSQAVTAGIIASSGDAIISVDAERRIVEWNHAAETIFGYSRAEAIGMDLARLLPVRFRVAHDAHIASFAAEHREARRMESRRAVGVRKNGEEFPVAAMISQLDVDGERILTVSLRDVTVERRAEIEQRILADVGGVLSILDSQRALRGLARILTRPGSLADRVELYLREEDGTLRRIVAGGETPMQTSPASAQLVREAVTTRHAASALGANDPRFRSAIPLVVGDAALGALWLASSRRLADWELRLLAEIARRAALHVENARLREAERRATRRRDEVLGVVAHDLRNPLNAMLLQAALLRRPGGEPDRRNRRPGQAIERAGRRMTRIIDDLLDVTQLEAGQLKLTQASVSPDDLVTEAVESQRELCAARSLELRQSVPAGLPSIRVDRERALQVFENLVGNAMKFTGSGSIVIGAKPRGDEVLFWVADTGPGISEDAKAHLFDRFWQARATHRAGAGLGLAIVKGIVEAHRGRVWVESEPGRGSTFFFTLPAVEARTASPPEEPTRDWSVVVAEDDSEVRDALVSLLGGHGYDVTGVGNGRDAIELLHHRPGRKLLILDLALPVVDGWEVLAEKERSKDLHALPVIVVSGRRDDTGRVAAANAHFLPKPLSPERLFEVMNELTKARREPRSDRRGAE